MDVSGRIAFPPLEPVDDFEPAEHVYYDIICDVIQPDARITMNDAVERIVAAFPSNERREVWLFGDLCCEVATHTPHNHPAQTKLVTIMDLVLCSQKINEVSGDSVLDRTRRYQRLKETISDLFSSSRPSDGVGAYINFQSFIARVMERGVLLGTDLAIYTCDDVFKDPEKVGLGEVESRVIAASQYILLLGQRIYSDVLDPHDRCSMTVKQWQRWHKELEAAVSEEPPKRYTDLCEEARDMAERALEEMRTIEWKMGVPAVSIGFSKRLWLRMQCTRLSRSWPFWR